MSIIQIITIISLLSSCQLKKGDTKAVKIKTEGAVDEAAEAKAAIEQAKADTEKAKTPDEKVHPSAEVMRAHV